MGAKRLPMRKLREVLRLKYDRRMGHRAIARACGVGVGTVSEYVGRARRAGLSWEPSISGSWVSHADFRRRSPASSGESWWTGSTVASSSGRCGRSWP